MTGSEHPESPREIFEPEYPGGETHPSVRRDERIEPWVIATAGFLGDYEFTHDFASGRRYDAPTMMKVFVYQRIVGVESFHGLASHLDGRPKVAALLGFTEGVPSGDTFRECDVQFTENYPETYPNFGLLITKTILNLVWPSAI